jgi:hypothetical protein
MDLDRFEWAKSFFAFKGMEYGSEGQGYRKDYNLLHPSKVPIGE